MSWAIEESAGLGRRRTVCKFKTQREAIVWLENKEFKRWTKANPSEWEYCDGDISVKAWLKEVADE